MPVTTTDPLPDREAFDELLASIVEDDLPVAKAEQLYALLAKNPDWQAEFVDFLLLHELLDEMLGREGLKGVVDMLGVPVAGSASHADPVSLRKSRPGLALGLAAIAATALIAFAIRLDSPSTEGRTGRPAAGTQPIAKLAEGHNFRFGEGQQPQGGAFNPGSYHLEEGAIGVSFTNGTKLVVESPADFDLIDAMTVSLKRGRVRLHVPEEAHGFTVQTPDFEVEDLGTEFGLSVDENHNADVHVFAGKVRLRQEGKLLREIAAGKAVAWQAQDWKDLEQTHNEDFATPADLGFRIRNDHKAALIQDDSLVLYYDFDIDPSQPTVVSNATGDRSLDGTVRGGVSVRGRWNSSRAMLFESFDHSVEVDIPGKFESFTITAWLQMHSLSWPYQAIMNTHMWPMGSHHLNVMRDGRLDAGIRRDLVQDGPNDWHLTSPADTLRVGTWTHVAAVGDAAAGRVAYFVDGRLVASSEVELPSESFAFGPCTIGNWKGSTRGSGLKHYGRPLCGRIDEIAFFDRPLPEEEIAEHYRAGNGF